MVLAIVACADVAQLPISAGTGSQPTLPPPQQRLIPTVNIAPAKGWPAGETPVGAPGTRVVAFASELDHPRWLYVLPNGDVLVAETNAPSGPANVVDLPGGVINHHWTKNLIASADRTRLYVTVGSNSNVAERGMEVEAERAAIWEVDAKTGTHRIYASGLRNPNRLAWEPGSGALWVVVNGRPVGVVVDHQGALLVADDVGNVVWRISAAR
jgi:glucose/arabinose dehydrogenase